MSKIRSSFLYLSFLAAMVSPLASNAQQTADNAHKFISIMLKGRQLKPADHRDHPNHSDDEIFYVRLVESSGCTTRIYSSPDNGYASVNLQVDWSKVGAVRGASFVVQLEGGMKYISPAPEETFDQVVWFNIADFDDVGRISTALNFLRKSCDQAVGLGF